MQWAGFVLAGGRSTRMGRDKAQLEYRGSTLLERIALAVREAAGAVALIGEPKLYAHLGYPVFADRIRGCGPIGGVHTALSETRADWNLVVACDMPGISADALRHLLERTRETHARCVAAAGPDGSAEPLCAAYHRDCLPILAQAIRDKRLKMRDLLTALETEVVAVDLAAVANVNTPAEWDAFRHDETR